MPSNLELRNSLRIGLGFDSHRIASGGKLILGGVIIEEGRHFVGHSDADVLLHAITDALLSAAALPDIGQLFPNDRPENKGRDSAEMLGLAFSEVRRKGFDLVNLDCVVHLETPKISPNKERMIARIASILAVPESSISLKGKTGEGVGEVGRGEFATAQCVALLLRD